MLQNKASVLWFRNDLRLDDNPALAAAAAKGDPIIPIFIWAPHEEGNWPLGAASRWWLHHALASLQEELRAIGLSLVIVQGKTLSSLLKIVQETGADAIFWNRRYEPAVLQREALLQAELQKKGVTSHVFNGSLLYEPWTIRNKQHKPFQVFTPFWKTCLSSEEPELPLHQPKKIPSIRTNLHSESLEALELLPKIHWDGGLAANWEPGIKGAKKAIKLAVSKVVEDYVPRRDFPAIRGTSHLSPYLHFGELSPRIIWHEVKNHFKDGLEKVEPFLRQLGWREFAHHLLYHFPRTTDEPLHSRYAAFPWLDDPEGLTAWQKGMTGYPIVDAGMRELWTTGWMHNRVRMIVGSFLVKDLLIPWQEGAKWFWDTLVDADLANNTLGWQWVAGCGADAAPYFRIFNPILQGEKFDPDGEYVKKWVPELSKLPAKWIHRPWEAPEGLLTLSGVELGKTYPRPIVDHAAAKQRALDALKGI